MSAEARKSHKKSTESHSDFPPIVMGVGLCQLMRFRVELSANLKRERCSEVGDEPANKQFVVDKIDVVGQSRPGKNREDNKLMGKSIENWSFF